MTTRYIKIIIPALAILATAGAFAGIPALRQHFVSSSSKVQTLELEASVTKDVDPKQKAILKEMSEILHGIDTLSVLTFTGTIKVIDQADSSNSLSTLFTYTRQGKEGYYRIADNEIAALNSAYIVVSNDTKKIFVSGAKQMPSPITMPVKQEMDLLSQEGYDISRKETGSISEITLLNMKHATCREYRLAFDSTGRIHHVKMRLSELTDMARTEKDKLINVTVDNWSSTVVRNDLLKMERYVIIKNGVSVPSPAYEGYDVISDL
jgi:hypothetical protein